jgi:hypothetical protein
VPFGTYKTPMTHAIDNVLTFFVCFSQIVVPVIIFIIASRKSRQFFKLEQAMQSKDLKDIINNF